MNKKLMIFLLLSILMISLLAGFAEAKPIGEYWDDITGSKILRVLTVDMVQEFNSGSPSTEAQVVAKALFTLLLFAILFGATSMAPGIKDYSKNNRMMITLLLSIVASFAIPASWLVTVVQTYGGLFILALMFLPAILLIYANFKWVKGHGRGIQFIKFLFMVGLLFVLQHLSNIAEGMRIDILDTAVGVLEIVFGFLALWYIIVGVVMNSSEKGSEIKDGLAATNVGNWFKKVGAYLPTKERRLGRKMKKFAKKSEKSMDEIKKELNVVNNSLTNARTNPNIVPQISEQVENIKPAVITGLENIKEFESIEREIKKWNSGYIAGLKTEREELKQEAAIAKGKITRSKLQGAAKQTQEDIIKSHEQTILQIDSIVEDSEAIFSQLRTMEDIYRVVDGDVHKIWESLGKLKMLLDTKGGDYLNESYRVNSESIKLANKTGTNQKKLEEYITNVRALIDKERIDVRKVVRNIKKIRRTRRKARKK